MKKDKILDKFVKKDYNNKLEEILSKKDFKEEVKNTLLTIFYKIENGYNDYKKIKVDTFDKNEYIEKLINIIDKDCKKIEFITKDNVKQEQVNKEKKEIICYPIETKILYSLAKIQKRNIVVKYIEPSIEKAITLMLNIGNNINMVEPLRDFNGFSWNTITKDIEDLNCNLIYQNIIYLTGNKFVDKWVNNYEPLVDYFELFQSNIESKYGKRIKNSIIDNLIILSLKINAIYDEKFKAKIMQKKQELEKAKQKIENKAKYLEEISKIKKQKEMQIKKIDKIINSKKLLIQEYENKNKQLPLEKKIFSIRVLKNNLEKERKQILEEIKNCNDIMRPKIFLEKKNVIEKSLKYFEGAENIELSQNIINLQKQIIKCMQIDLKNVKEKNKLISIIYKLRYYILLPISPNAHIYEIKELKKALNQLIEELIKKSIEMKTITKISNKEEINNKIIKEIITSKIIELEDIGIKILQEKENLILTIFDEKIQESKTEINDIEPKDINIRFNKKIKIIT